MHKAEVVQFEILGKDGVGLTRSDASLFGWRDVQATPAPGFCFTALNQPGIPGGIGGLRDAGTSQLTVKVEVDDVVKHLSYAEELGGRMIRLSREVQSPQGAFTYALFADPEGNVVGLSRDWSLFWQRHVAVLGRSDSDSGRRRGSTRRSTVTLIPPYR